MDVSEFFRTFGPRTLKSTDMKRVALTSFVWVVSLLMAVAAPVSEQAAKQAAQEFMKRQMRANTRGEAVELTRAFTGIADGDDAGIFVFNSSTGFVVMSADDELPAVLAYSTGAPFDAQTAPEAMKFMLEAYHMAATTDAFTRADVPTHDKVSPLIKTQWDQHEPYNLLCPKDDAGNLCLTGCVATSMAQVMYYHKCPADFDWDNMKTTYDGSESSTANNAVAKLMADCGTAVFMKYGSGSSSAYEIYACEALRYDFGYAETTDYVRREAYTAKSWDALIYNELAAKRPVLYAGSSISSAKGSSGHAFVIDGYEAKDGLGYYHVNWGWSGKSDSYFLISVLNPSYQYAGGNAGSSGYSVKQEAIVGIQPAAKPMEKTKRLRTYQMYVNEDKGTYSRASTSEDFPTIKIVYDFYNVLLPEESRHYDVALALYKDRKLVSVLKEFCIDDYHKNEPLEYNYGFKADPTYPFAYDMSIGKDLADGNYQLRVLSRLTGASEWHWAYGAIDNYVELAINGKTMNTITYGLYDEAAESDFTINSVDVKGTMKVGEPLMITINLTDKNKTGNAPIYLWGNASPSAGADNYQLLTGGGSNLDPGQTGEIVLEYTPQRAGDFKFILSGSSKNYDVPLYTFTASVSGICLVLEMGVDDVVSTQSNGIKNLSGTTLKGVAKITNLGSSAFDDKVYFWMIGTSAIGQAFGKVSTTPKSVAIPIGQTVDVPFSYTDLGSDYYYGLILYVKDGDENWYLNATKTANNQVSFSYSVVYHTGDASGLRAIAIDAEDADVYNMNGVRVGKASELKSMPKGVYIINKKKVLNR